MSAGLGRVASADNVLKRSKTECVSHCIQALLLLVLGKTDEVFKLLNKAYEEQEAWLCWTKIDPAFDSIRSDPRFIALPKKHGLEP